MKKRPIWKVFVISLYILIAFPIAGAVELVGIPFCINLNVGKLAENIDFVKNPIAGVKGNKSKGIYYRRIYEKFGGYVIWVDDYADIKNNYEEAMDDRIISYKEDIEKNDLSLKIDGKVESLEDNHYKENEIYDLLRDHYIKEKNIQKIINIEDYKILSYYCYKRFSDGDPDERRYVFECVLYNDSDNSIVDIVLKNPILAIQEENP